MDLLPFESETHLSLGADQYTNPKKHTFTFKRTATIAEMLEPSTNKKKSSDISLIRNNVFDQERASKIAKKDKQIQEFIYSLKNELEPEDSKREINLSKFQPIGSFGHKTVTSENSESDDPPELSDVKTLITRELISRENVFESEDSEEELNSTTTWYFVNTNPLYFWFKLGVDLQAAVSVLMVPLMLLLRETNQTYFALFTSVSAWMTFFLLIDCLFPLDFILCFFRAEEDKGEIITNKLILVSKYVISYFFVDILASIPLSVFLCTENTWITDFSYYIMSWLVVFCRFLKLFESNSPFKNFEIFIKPVSNRLFKFILLFQVFMHIFSCFFAVLFSTQRYFAGACDDNSSNSLYSQYFDTLYYSFASVLTVGYGDMSPCTQDEQVFAVIFISMGAMFYSALISLLSTVFAIESIQKKKINEKLHVLRKINNEYGLEYNIYLKLKNHIQHNVAMKSKYFLYLISELPVNLRKQLLESMYQNVLMNISIFKNKAEEVIFFILSNLVLSSFDKGEVLVEESSSFHEIYIQHRGSLQMQKSIRSVEVEIGQVKPNSSLGEVQVSTFSPSEFTVTTKKQVQSFILSSILFYEVSMKFPEYSAEILKEATAFNHVIESRIALAEIVLDAEGSRSTVKEAIKILNEVIFGFLNRKTNFVESIDQFKENEVSILKDIKKIFEEEDLLTRSKRKMFLQKRIEDSAVKPSFERRNSVFEVLDKYNLKVKPKTKKKKEKNKMSMESIRTKLLAGTDMAMANTTGMQSDIGLARHLSSIGEAEAVINKRKSYGEQEVVPFSRGTSKFNMFSSNNNTPVIKNKASLRHNKVVIGDTVYELKKIDRLAAVQRTEAKQVRRLQSLLRKLK